MYTVYVLYATKYDRLYIGFTSDLENRLLSHNSLAKKGFTVKFRPWKLIHTEVFSTQAKAMKREKQLKSGQGRKWIRDSFL
ncbi:MAG: GIY-YIG nuclease family protein [Bacteroidales bacterium]|nr:GIY-YIG nuclease family protein [Bacteroidales bacterium]